MSTNLDKAPDCEEILRKIHIAKPCPARWDDMDGDERVRFCGQCKKNVYNISGMKAREAVELLQNRQGSICLHFYRRKDGKVLTADCPVGLALFRKRVAISLATGVALMVFMVVWPVELMSQGTAPIAQTFNGIYEVAFKHLENGLERITTFLGFNNRQRFLGG